MCDGFTSSSILWNYIKEIEPDADLHFITQQGKKHGLEAKMDWLELNHFDLIITPDAGSYDKEQMERLIELGSEILAEDHHSPLLDEDGSIHIINNPHAVIINNQLSEKYQNKSLCGAGVVYKFCQALDNELGVSKADKFIDLVALGEIADVMFQGTNETRYYIKKGLLNINNEGFKALLAAQDFSLKGKGKPPYAGLTPIDIAFYISPLINAVTRMGTEQENEVMFYAFTDPFKKLQSTKRGAKVGDVELACEQLARIAGNIRQRQNKAIDKAMEIIVERIEEQHLADNNVIMVEVEKDDNIPLTITGLLAQKVLSMYGKPCLIGRTGTDGFLRGSMRSSGNFASLPNFKEFLEKSEMFDYIAGHFQASGFSLEKTSLPTFITYVNSTLSSKDFENCYHVDYIFDANDSSIKTVGNIIGNREDCFGNGVDEVKIVVKNIPTSSLFVMGATKDSAKISYNGVDYVRFKDLDFIERAKDWNKVDIYGKININEYMGRKSLQFFILDYEKSKDENRYEF